jgi:hypothetical protein
LDRTAPNVNYAQLIKAGTVLAGAECDHDLYCGTTTTHENLAHQLSVLRDDKGDKKANVAEGVKM